uniref:Retrovirus-related Pol polyprotein from transposon TNT 1-94-like beta-barrel domain-containing protein n=1 Tax=Chenopodium quinoa TaxID=63459 RepID=A0A803NAW6_CHEQI
MEDVKVRNEKFDGKYFGFWKMQIEDYLHQRDLYQPLEETKLSGMKEEDWKVLDRKALGVVRLSLSRNVAYNVKDEKTTAGLIKTLSSMYEKPSATKLKSDNVRDLILSESTRRRESGESSDEAYAFESRGRGRQQCGSASHHGRSKSRGSGRSNANVLCLGCGGEGYVKRSCPKIKKNGKGKSQGSDEDEDASTNSVTEYDSDALCVSTECSVDAWVLNSGSSVHSTPCKELFRSFKFEKLEGVHLANGECVEVMGSGNVSVKLMNGGLLELKDVM